MKFKSAEDAARCVEVAAGRDGLFLDKRQLNVVIAIKQGRKHGSRIVGLGVRELTLFEFVYSVCTVLMVSFGGPHFLKIIKCYMI